MFDKFCQIQEHKQSYDVSHKPSRGVFLVCVSSMCYFKVGQDFGWQILSPMLEPRLAAVALTLLLWLGNVCTRCMSAQGVYLQKVYVCTRGISAQGVYLHKVYICTRYMWKSISVGDSHKHIRPRTCLILSLSLSLSLLKYLRLCCVSVLPACMSVPCMYAVLEAEARRLIWLLHCISQGSLESQNLWVVSM